ncbi:hypothetical protein GCM10027429_09570 [Marivirga atlantica]|jgi:hypothetical protein|uniref:Sulfotransferase domain-containing protein n=1 Tax=Marivirga atlantica TaxID=1548457 RepID=A0A937DJ67_9BACT|nr:hypothetical protein [Marivirga atlantica]MBL0764569.1 hypothetical protein [Marivirga atlantica]
MSETQLFFHVGLGKNASTFLQQRFFPKLKEIHYTQSNIYRFFPKIVAQAKHSKYLFSREFDRQFYIETNKIADLSKDANIIIILRRNDSWIASQYRRYVKNGGKQTFSEFIDLENDNGEWKQKDLYFYPMLEHLQKNFNTKPLILFYDDLKKDAEAFLDRIAGYLNASYNIADIDLSVKHSSYSEKQLKFIFKHGPFDKSKSYKTNNRIAGYLNYRSKWLVNHIYLALAKRLPEIDKNKKLITQNELEKVEEFYREDWQKCIEFAQKHSA